MRLLSVVSIFCLAVLASTVQIDQHATTETKNLFIHLREVARDRHKVMFGHQKDTLLGAIGGHSPYRIHYHDNHVPGFEFTINQVHSNSPDELSDTKSITGHYPAVLGLDFADGEDDTIKIVSYLGKKAYARGQVVTLCWHMHNPVTGGDSWGKWLKGNGSELHTLKRILPGGDHNWKFNQNLDKIVHFAQNFKDSHGKLIPFILRLFHEQNGGWFWWGVGGKSQNSAEDVKAIYKYSVDYIKNKKNVHNILYAISPDKYRLNSKDDYMSVYPGDDYVDIVGLDIYYDHIYSPTTAEFQKKVELIVDFAESRGKIPALTEIGLQHNGLKDHHNFWNDHVLDLMKQNPKCARVAFMLTWSTMCFSGCEYWMPWKGHPAEANFLAFYKDPLTVFV